MDNWTVGQKEKIDKNSNFYLEFERLKGSEISKRFNAENFKFKVSLKPKHNKILLLNDDNVNYVMKGLLNIFEKIRKSFRKRNGKAYIQINLTFDGLKKVYLKSGIINLFDKHSKNIVYWIINQLNQVEQSSEDLVFSNNFVCDFMVIQTNHPCGKMNFIQKSSYKSSFSKQSYMHCLTLKLGLFFNTIIKQGYVDMKMFFSDIFEESNCLLVSIYFGIIFQNNNFDFSQTIGYIYRNFKNTISFESEFKKHYNVCNMDYLKTKQLSFTLNYLSNKIKRDILLFSISKHDLPIMYYSTGNYKNKWPIKILIESNHTMFIFDNNNLEKKRSCFCDFCRKSFSSTTILMHKCKGDKCINCFLYKDDMNQIVKGHFCNSKYVEDIHFECKYCNKIIKNKKCKERHEQLNQSQCTYTMYCNICKKNYSKTKNHECGKKFCKKCLSYHKSQLFCSTHMIKKKNIKQTTFFCDFKYDGSVPYLFTICQFENSEYINIFQFINNCNFYTKKVISRNGLQNVSTETLEWGSKFEIENIIQELDIINLKPIMLFDKIDFEYLMNNMDLERFELCTQNNHVHKMLSKFYTLCKMDQYLQFDIVYVLNLLKLDICPLYLIEPQALNNFNLEDNLATISINDFTKEYKHSDMNMFHFIERYNENVVDLKKMAKKTFLKRSSTSKIIILLEAFMKMDVLLKSIADKMDNEIGERINNFEGIFQFGSFSSAVFSIFLSSIYNQQLPTLGSITPGNLFNTSKYEISLCEVLNDFHNKKYKNHNVKSYVNGDGQQYTKGRLSVDWYCFECKTCIFVEGNFKYYCQKHENTVKHVFKNKDRKTLYEKGKIKREDFMNQTKDIIEKTFVIAQCCIMKDDYNDDFKTSNLYYKDFGKNVLQLISNFKREEYQRMNFQNALSPAFTVNCEDRFISDGQSYANKYDINSAYLSVLTDEDFKLPTSNIQETIFVNKDANSFFHTLNIYDKNFALLKGFVTSNNMYKLPFMPIITKSKIISYSNCSKCLNELTNENCCHSQEEKGHFVEGYLHDFLYMKSIGYSIKVVQIIYFKSEHNKKLGFLANAILQERKNECKFIQKIAKITALIGLGRFALNISKIPPSHANIMTSNQEISLQMELKGIDNISFFNKYAIAFSNPKISNFENLKRSTRLNCSSLIFGMVSSFIRKEMYEFYTWTENSNIKNIKVLRIDTDSIIIKCQHKEDFKLIEKYISESTFSYKLELAEINILLNFSRKSHFYCNMLTNTLKVCGLRISLYERYNKIDQIVNAYVDKMNKSQ